MALGTPSSVGSGGDNITHFGAIRVRGTGAGNLTPTFYSLDDVSNQALVVLPQSATREYDMFRLANFITQQAVLELKTTAIDETFKINRIIIFAKTLWISIPA